MLADVFDPYTLRMVLLPVLGGLAICAFLVVRFVSRSMLKVSLLALLVVIGVVVSQERAGLSDCVQSGECTIFGRSVEAPGR